MIRAGLGRALLALLPPLLAVISAAIGPAASHADTVADREITRAQAMLAEAEAELKRASDDDARLRALGLAVRGHEAALAALRTGLRVLAAEERQLARGFATESARMGAVLGALQRVARAPRSALLAYPGGPLNAARAASLMSEMTPALARTVEDVRTRLRRLQSVRAAQQGAAEEAVAALGTLQSLRAEAARAVRRGRPSELGAEVTAQALTARRRAWDLNELSRTLGASLPDTRRTVAFETLRGRLLRPVAGRITGIMGGVDPWGRTAQGVTFTAPAYAQIVAPADGTVRYAGELIDYGTVIVLETAPDWMIVIAGIKETGRAEGEAVLAGEPLGSLGGPLPTSEEFLLEAQAQAGQIETEELYVELRDRGEPVDPAPWFDTAWQ